MALAKYHAVTLTLRLFEAICAQFCTDTTMDKLTMDYFAASRTMAQNLVTAGGNHSNTAPTTATAAVRERPLATIKEMTETTFWANLLISMADYGVHQVLLCYGYYMYYQRQRRSSSNNNTNEDRISKLRYELTDQLVHHSAQLLSSRSLGLVCGAVGGGIGTIIWPGWGTLMMSSMGESAAGSLVDDGSAAAKAELTSDKPKLD